MKAEDLIGLNDEELGLGLEQDKLIAWDNQVLSGHTLSDREGSLFIHGRLHQIRIAETPVYLDGRIIGLIGCYEEEKGIRQKDEGRHYMTAGEFMAALSVIYEQSFTTDKPYQVMFIETRSMSDGTHLSDDLIAACTEAIRQQVCFNVGVGYLGGGVFALLCRQDCRSEEKRKDRSRHVREAVENIHMVKGRAMTMQAEIRCFSTQGMDHTAVLISILQEMEKVLADRS